MKTHFQRNLFLLLFFIPASVLGQSLIQYVDPLIGTAPATTESAKRHSEAGSELRGQTFPAVGRPFGMTQWTPETRPTEAKCVVPYYYNDEYITGFRGSHWMDGSCTQDYGTVTIMPFYTENIDTVQSCPTATLNHRNENAKPNYYSISLTEVDTEIAGSVRSGFFPFYVQTKGK